MFGTWNQIFWILCVSFYFNSTQWLPKKNKQFFWLFVTSLMTQCAGRQPKAENKYFTNNNNNMLPSKISHSCEWDPFFFFSRNMKHETIHIYSKTIINYIYDFHNSFFVALHFMRHHNCLNNVLATQFCRFTLHTHSWIRRNGSNAKAVPFITNKIMTKMRFRCCFHWLAQLNRQLYSIDLTSGCESIFSQFHI